MMERTIRNPILMKKSRNPKIVKILLILRRLPQLPPPTSRKMLHSLYISKHKNTAQYKADSMGCRIKHTSNRLSANNSYLLLNIARTHIRQSVLGEKNINPIGKENMKSVFNLALCNFFAHEIDKAD